MYKKIALFSLFSLGIISCNKVRDAVDEVRMRQMENITYDDYSTISDKFDRKIFYTNDKELMTGHFMVVYKRKPAEEFQLKRGLLNGIYSYYNTKGQLTKTLNYKNGRKDGIQQEFYTSGEIYSEVTYAKGKMVGEEIIYNKAGEIKSKTKVENGISYRRYYKDGKLTDLEFKKDWEGKKLKMLVLYDAFENVEFAVGKSNDPKEKNIFYVFDANMQFVESVDIVTDPQKASYYFSLIRGNQ